MRLRATDLMIAMAKKQLNFSKLAKECGVSRVTLSYIKNGKSCKPDVAGKIAKALDVSPEEIFDVID